MAMIARTIIILGAMALASCQVGEQRSSPVAQTLVKPQEGPLNCAGGPMDPLTPEVSKRLADIKEAMRPVAEVAAAGANRTPDQTASLVQAMMNVGGPKEFADMAKYWVDHTPTSSSECSSLLGIQRFWEDLAAKRSR